ncbi:hypothetical protein HYH03_002069 [Edaphochlamys debaryana]|uniref:SBP-type domain-containing protein n=1 Tax=Edaphochlamys debaryana TaxID=47281 RepID=A0A835YBC5_9CHLO|nr:hypothetical protein HYH03_002069 [Edaphochlamys debaryana]|eukprot:KAG2499772.1 hypothetical protein HYH03_002069 [Edaphochlamys debaryana]
MERLERRAAGGSRSAAVGKAPARHDDIAHAAGNAGRGNHRGSRCKVLLQEEGAPQRYCQQCGKFHDATEFDGIKRSCREKLALHAARRRASLAQRRHLAHKLQDAEERMTATSSSDNDEELADAGGEGDDDGCGRDANCNGTASASKAAAAGAAVPPSMTSAPRNVVQPRPSAPLGATLLGIEPSPHPCYPHGGGPQTAAAAAAAASLLGSRGSTFAAVHSSCGGGDSPVTDAPAAVSSVLLGAPLRLPTPPLPALHVSAAARPQAPSVPAASDGVSGTCGPAEALAPAQTSEPGHAPAAMVRRGSLPARLCEWGGTTLQSCPSNASTPSPTPRQSSNGAACAAAAGAFVGSVELLQPAAEAVVTPAAVTGSAVKAVRRRRPARDASAPGAFPGASGCLSLSRLHSVASVASALQSGGSCCPPAAAAVEAVTAAPPALGRFLLPTRADSGSGMPPRLPAVVMWSDMDLDAQLEGELAELLGGLDASPPTAAPCQQHDPIKLLAAAGIVFDASMVTARPSSSSAQGGVAPTARTPQQGVLPTSAPPPDGGPSLGAGQPAACADACMFDAQQLIPPPAVPVHHAVAMAAEAALLLPSAAAVAGLDQQLPVAAGGRQVDPPVRTTSGLGSEDGLGFAPPFAARLAAAVAFAPRRGPADSGPLHTALSLPAVPPPAAASAAHLLAHASSVPSACGRGGWLSWPDWALQPLTAPLEQQRQREPAFGGTSSLPGLVSVAAAEARYGGATGMMACTPALMDSVMVGSGGFCPGGPTSAASLAFSAPGHTAALVPPMPCRPDGGCWLPLSSPGGIVTPPAMVAGGVSSQSVQQPDLLRGPSSPPAVWPAPDLQAG